MTGTREAAERLWRSESLPALQRTLRYELHSAVADALLALRRDLDAEGADRELLLVVDEHLDRSSAAARRATDELDVMPGGPDWSAMRRAVDTL